MRPPSAPISNASLQDGIIAFTVVRVMHDMEHCQACAEACREVAELAARAS